MNGSHPYDDDKKAAHVKWAGKTIALGTFTTADAEEKCQRAKALTKTWRQTMRPKPSREWVMAELERHGVRAVSGRRGTSENASALKKSAALAVESALNKIGAATAACDASTPAALDMFAVPQAAWSAMSDTNRRTSLDHLGLAASIMSSGTMNDSRNDPVSSSTAAGSEADEVVAQCSGDGKTFGSSSLDVISFLQKEVGFFDDDNIAADSKSASGPGAAAGSLEVARRPFVGGGAAAAYEAARADHYRNLAEQQRQESTMNRSRAEMPTSSSPGGSSAMADVKPNSTLREQYEMLKLHQMSLLQEVQETTMMMNLYQQQMLQHQHEQYQVQQQQMQQQQQQHLQQRQQQHQEQQISAITSQEMGVSSQLRGNGGAQHYEMQQHKDQQQEKQTIVGDYSNRTVPNETNDETADEIRKLKEKIVEQERKMRQLERESGNGDVSNLAGDIIKHRVSDQESDQYTKRARTENGALDSSCSHEV